MLPVERAKLPVKRGWLAAALWRFISLNPIRLASDLVKAVIYGHVPIPNGSQLPAQRRRARNQPRFWKLVWELGHMAAGLIRME